jgi:hypothetical protein
MNIKHVIVALACVVLGVAAGLLVNTLIKVTNVATSPATMYLRCGEEEWRNVRHVAAMDRMAVLKDGRTIFFPQNVSCEYGELNDNPSETP